MNRVVGGIQFPDTGGQTYGGEVPAPGAPPPVDARDARITELEAALSKKQAELVTAQGELVALQQRNAAIEVDLAARKTVDEEKAAEARSTPVETPKTKAK